MYCTHYTMTWITEAFDKEKRKCVGGEWAVVLDVFMLPLP